MPKIPTPAPVETAQGNMLASPAFRAVAVMAVLVLLFAFVFFWIRWMKDNRSADVPVEPVPTAESFRKNYVQGCELGMTSFAFDDGATLSGDFASCPAERNVSFFATTTTLRVTGKEPLAVHTVMAEENGTQYPVAQVYMKLPQAMLDVMFNGRKLASTTKEELGFSSTTITMDDIRSAGTSTQIFMIRDGYFIGMHRKASGSGLWFNQGTLRFTSN